tara:strand:- start:141 stop:1613 length:1473 start_codon:yes stop_codon:yes gene_type:complete
MAFVKLELPAGVYSHGTEYEATGRWHDASLVRWQGKSIQPVGGWTTRAANVVAETPRACHTWLENGRDPYIAVGTYNKLYSLTYGSTVSDITPTGLVVGVDTATENLGFGGKAFGIGSYGVERPSDGVFQEVTTWTLDNWGQNLIGCSTADGKLYEWPLTGLAAQISNSPENCISLIATAERFLFAIAADGNPRKLAWSDREDNTTWTPAATNEAGDFELQTDGELMMGIKIRGRTLFLTTRDAHLATYSGPPTVYGFENVGTSCGVISRHAAASIGDGAFWMGRQNFFFFNGSSVQALPCEVMDHVFTNINRAQMSKTYCVHNGRFNEIWWFYPSGTSVENDRYVVYDYAESHWSIGVLDRTCGVDSGVFTRPIWFDHNANAYNHETGNAYDGNLPYVESGPVNIGSGDNVMHVTQLIPDELAQGEVTATFKTRFYPNTTERTYGPYSMSSPTSVRMTGRQIKVRFTGQEYKNWRIGTMRVDVTQGGKR